MSGTWSGSETSKTTITYRGQTERSTDYGSGSITISQTGCNASFSSPGRDPLTGAPISIPRTGPIVGNIFRFSGKAGIPVPGVTYRQNVLTGVGTVSQNTLRIQTTGTITGTYQGSDFVITVTSSGVYDGSRPWAPPVITRQPTNETIIVGAPVTFRIAATGPGSLAYQWRLNGTNIFRATNATYTIPAVNFSHGGEYTATVRNFDGPVSSDPAVLTVVTSPFTSARGSYNGLFYESEARHESSGSVRLTVDQFGLYSARIISAGKTNTFTGQFDLSGLTTKDILRGNTPLVLSLALDLIGAGPITGTITSSNWVADLTAFQTVYNNATNPAAFAGRYTVAIPPDPADPEGPGGNGFASLQIDGSGNTALSGKLADGESLNRSSVVGRDGALPVYVPLYRNKGCFLAWLHLSADKNLSNEDTIWIRPPMSSALYPDGFVNHSQALGSAYQWFRTNRVLNCTNALLIFSGGGLEPPLTNAVTLAANNKVTAPRGVGMTINPTNGVFSGFFKAPGTSRTNRFNGIVLQNANFGPGYFLTPSASGHVLFQPVLP